MKDASVMKADAKSKNIKELEFAIDTITRHNDSIATAYWNNLKRTTYNAKTDFNAKDTADMIKNNIFRMDADSVFNAASKKTKLMWKRAQLNKVKQLKTDYEIKNNILHAREKDLNKHKQG